MKKIKALSITLLAIMIFSPLPVSAHAGGTDGSGGHTDSSTGEYHYHHGYPAHDHYDMDGDGDLDCPYEYKDNTKNNASTESSESIKDRIARLAEEHEESSSYSVTTNNSTHSVSPSENTQTVITETEYIYKDKFPTWAIWFALSLGFSILGLSLNIRDKKSEIKDLKDQIAHAHNTISQERCSMQEKEATLKAEIEKVEHDLKEQVSQFQSSCIALLKENGIENPTLSENPEIAYAVKEIRDIYSDEFLLKFAKVPDGVFIGEDDFPYSKDDTDCKWGQRYTLFFNPSTLKCHRYSCSHSSHCIQKNVVEVCKSSYVDLCKACSPIIPDLKWYYKFISMRNYVNQAANFQQPITPKMLKAIIREKEES